MALTTATSVIRGPTTSCRSGRAGAIARTQPQAYLPVLRATATKRLLTLNCRRSPPGSPCRRGLRANFRQDVRTATARTRASPARRIGTFVNQRTHPLRDAAGGSLPDLSNGGAQTVGQNNFESI